MKYADIKDILKKRLHQQKKGLLNDGEIKEIINKWQSECERKEYDDEIIAKEVKKLEKKFEKYNVPVVGYVPVDRPEGVFRIHYAQLNNASSGLLREIKIGEVQSINAKYDINANVFAEVGRNFSVDKPGEDIASWFDDQDNRKCASAWNKTDSIIRSKHQQGGTSIVVHREFAQYAKKGFEDFRKLGRWCSFTFFASPHHRFRLVVAYNVCNSRPKGLKTIYQQQIRYIQNNGTIKCGPKALFRRDFVRQCAKWRKNGERLLIVMDANEHTMDGPLRRMLETEGVNLREFSHDWWGRTPPHTYVNGKIPIDSGFATDDVEVVNLCMLPFYQSVGDHRNWIIDITTRSMLGEHLNKIVHPVSRRLVMGNQPSVDTYNAIVDEQFARHRIPQRMDAVDNLTRICGGGPDVPPWLRSMIIRLYKQMDEIRIHAEKKCRKIRRPAADFSPEIQYWYDKAHAYLALIRLKSGDHPKMNRCNTMRFAKRKNIDNPEGLTEEELRDGLRLARIRSSDLRRQAKGLRKTHNRNMLLDAQDKGDVERVKAIKKNINREHNRRMWYLIQKTVKDPRAPPVLKVQRVIDGEVLQYDTKEGVEEAIQKECEVRFTLAHSAPIMKHLLGHQLRYLSDQELAASIVMGNYEIPEELDPATRLILEEIGKMGMKIINGEGKEVVITPEDFKRFWRKVSEFTSSSPSGIHYAHYKASCQNELSSKIHAQQLTVIARSGIHPERWTVALQCMLEKIAGVCLVEKLRAIQLIEADFNFFQGFIFGHMAMNELTTSGFLPEEHFSKKGSTAEDAKFDKTLMFDLSRQARQPMTTTSVDAHTCYDRVNHIIMSLVWLVLTQCFGPIAVILACLQGMKFFQRTGHGDSNTYFGGSDLVTYLMGLGQGSRGAPASWVQISSVIVNIFRALDYGAKVIDPLTRNVIHTIGALFVDDTDVYVWHEHLMTADEVFYETQDEILMWGNLLCATGGALKPEKCFWYMVDYECVEGEWQYTEMVDYELMIPLPDGSQAAIEQKDVHEGTETLGVMDSPAGGNQHHLVKVHDKMDVWVKRMKNGHLPAHMGWVAYKLQLWPGLRYGIGTLTNDIEEAEEEIADLDYELLNVLGIARTVKKGWRRIHSTFGGFGLFTFTTEQLICRLNLLVQHYHTSSALSQKLDASLRYLQLQLGTNKCPFELPYDDWGFLAPRSWVKMLWRTIQKYDVSLHLHFDTIPLPRESDKVIMEMAISPGATVAQRMSISRMKGYYNVMFLSDVTTADGRNLESWVTNRDLAQPQPSRYKFPREVPTDDDWEVWIEFWREFTQEGWALPLPLGRWEHPTHREWQWFYDKETDTLQRTNNQNWIEYYVPATGRRRTRSEKRYISAWKSTPESGTEPIGLPVSVHDNLDDSVTLRQTGPPLVSGPSMPTDFWEFLQLWGGDWMWEHMDKTVDLTWVVQGMKNNSLVWVTDGSYDRKRAPDISGAGWVIWCTTSQRIMRCKFFERSDSASSYRAEQLGICAIHLFITALEEYYQIDTWYGTFCCDNKAALNLASWKPRRIRPGSSCADILRSIRSSNNRMKGILTFVHVDSHMDRILLWHQLNLHQQLNCICDYLAKSAVGLSSVLPDSDSDTIYILPREDVAVFIDGQKATSDFAKPIRYNISKTQARDYLQAEEGWTSAQFKEVDWDWLDKALENKPDMYKTWLAKQHTGFCGTRTQIAYYNKEYVKDKATKTTTFTGDISCPNCGEMETAAHLCVCPCEDRTRLLVEMTDGLEKWMSSGDKTNPEIAYWVPKYILYRGTKRFEDMGYMSPMMRELARSQDLIGWRNFMEGRISTHFYSIQNYHLTFGTSYLNGGDWTKQFISRILHITHSQWIYRNFSLHDKQMGYLRQKERDEVIREIDRLSQLRPEEIAPESRFLLEFDFDRLQASTFEQQQYWVVAMRAAHKAGRRVATSSARVLRAREAVRRKTNRRKLLGITDVERRIRLNPSPFASVGDLRRAAFMRKYSLSGKRKHASSLYLELKSNKRLNKPD